MKDIEELKDKLQKLSQKDYVGFLTNRKEISKKNDKRIYPNRIKKLPQ